MGYFTETMEALLEFKGDAEYSYKARMQHDRYKSEHDKKVGAMRLDKGSMHKDINGNPKIKTAKDYDEYQKTLQRRNRSLDNAEANRKEIRDGRKETERNGGKVYVNYDSPKKSCKESFSEAFESLVM